MSRLHVFIALITLASFAKGRPIPRPKPGFANSGVCAFENCFCDKLLTPYWTKVDCTVPMDDKLEIYSGDLPRSALELLIIGSNEVVFKEGSFTGSMDLRKIAIHNAKNITFQGNAGVDLRGPNMYLEIMNCDVLRFAENSFSKIGDAMTVAINNCNVLYIEGTAFSWILNMNITNVRELNVAPGAFALEPTADNIGDHGPGMSIILKNIKIPEIPKSAFGSSIGRLFMESVDIESIRTGAFSANTYNVVIAINCSLQLIEEEAFSENSLINYMNLDGCKIQQIKSQALRSAIATLDITDTSFENIETGAINTTVASVKILDSVFHGFMGNGFQFSSLSKLQMERNTFDELPPKAIATPGASILELIFNENEIETLHEDSLAFIGEAAETVEIQYKNNYYGQPCHCNITEWIGKALGANNSELYLNNSFCTVDVVIARCFNVPDQNMSAQKFVDQVCLDKQEIKCENYKTITNGTLTNIENPRFPHKASSEKGLSHRNAKVIGIVIVTCFGCILIAMIISLIRWLKRRGYCFSLKNFFMSSNGGCGGWCGRLCNRGNTLGVDNTISISQISINDYSERQYLNERQYHGLDAIADPSFQEITLDSAVVEPAAHTAPTIEKFTQTLPEKLSKHLLDNLKEGLQDPVNYVETREVIEHLYEISKLADKPTPTNSTPATTTSTQAAVENIYELPFQDTITQVGKKNQRMVSIGTKVPSLDKLSAEPPNYTQTPLAEEYTDPKDLTVHLYDEIANDKKTLGIMPDVIGEQPVPRGPYLQKVLSNPLSKKSTKSSNLNKKHDMTLTSPNSSVKMMNRPLPKKPIVDPGEGTSTTHG